MELFTHKLSLMDSFTHRFFFTDSLTQRVATTVLVGIGVIVVTAIPAKFEPKLDPNAHIIFEYNYIF